MNIQKLKLAKILFFIEGASPTAEQFKEAINMKATVNFRNALHVPAEGCLEPCDGVAGEIPSRYAETYPTAEEAIQIKEDELEALTSLAGDEKAPKVKAKSKAKDEPKAEIKPDAPEVWKANT